MDSDSINTISLCSGVGMLDEGLHAGLGHLGIRSRTVLYAEREAYPVAVLESRMEEGSIHPAPIWFGDFTELPAGQFRGVVDCVVAGFPCQDLSVAGKRAGLDGKRSGLFYEVVRIATDSEAWLMFLENVGGIASATASVVDEAEGELFERAAARVVGELADLGWDAEWMHLSASEVGASHGRERWFCIAWRNVADAQGRGGIRQRIERAGRAEVEGASEFMGNAESKRNGSGIVPVGIESHVPRIAGASGIVADSERHGRNQGRTESGREQGRHDAAECCCAVADADGIGRREEGNREQQSRRSDIGCLSIFAPGPDSTEWEWIIGTSPWLAPALESDFRGVVNGLAFDMDDCRAQRLKCIGNGVVALQAALAVVVLARRVGIA